MIKIVFRGKRAYLVQILRGKSSKVASFSAEGYKWWRDLMGTDELDDSFANWPRVAKAYIFAKVYPYTSSPHKLVTLLKEMEDFEAVYWMHTMQRFGQRAVYAFKRLFGV
ncbi:MAG: hypothetical protein QXP31_04745 [Pyrobaculum sp.]